MVGFLSVSIYSAAASPGRSDCLHGRIWYSRLPTEAIDCVDVNGTRKERMGNDHSVSFDMPVSN
jgi:hypothetical protein